MSLGCRVQRKKDIRFISGTRGNESDDLLHLETIDHETQQSNVESVLKVEVNDKNFEVRVKVENAFDEQNSSCGDFENLSVTATTMNFPFRNYIRKVSF